jgi:hypothetical protein
MQDAMKKQLAPVQVVVLFHAFWFLLRPFLHRYTTVGIGMGWYIGIAGGDTSATRPWQQRRRVFFYCSSDQEEQRDATLNAFRADIKIRRGLGHGFKFELKGPPTIEAALRAQRHVLFQLLVNLFMNPRRFLADRGGG